MNKLSYRNYLNRKGKWHIVSYHIITHVGRSGFGSMEIIFAGKPIKTDLEAFIKKHNPTADKIIIINIMPAQKNTKVGEWK